MAKEIIPNNYKADVMEEFNQKKPDGWPLTQPVSYSEPSISVEESLAENPTLLIPPVSREQPVKKQPTEIAVREIIETLLLTFFIFWLVNSFVGRYRIDGHSMNPTLADEQYLFINNVAYLLDEPQHGDIIVFRHPRNNLNLIKRVIGVPGDTVEVRDQQVFVNGQLLNEPYIQAPPNYTGSWSVPEEQYFVLGDNRNNSSDSHSWSFLPEENIFGKASYIYWPISDWASVPHYYFE